MPSCVKCGAAISKNDSFCGDCGAKVPRTSPPPKSARVQGSRVWPYAVLALVGLLVLGVGIVIFTVPFPYSATQAYNETEKHIAQEEYSESVPYTTTESYTAYERRPRITDGAIALQVAANSLDYPGISFDDINSGKVYCERTQRGDIWCHGPVYEPVPVSSSRTVTKYRNETRQRNVTQLRDVTRERSIVRSDTLFNQWTGQSKRYYAVGESP